MKLTIFACLLAGIFLINLGAGETDKQLLQKNFKKLKRAQALIQQQKARIEQLEKENDEESPNLLVYFLLIAGLGGWITLNCFLKQLTSPSQIWRKNKFKIVFLFSLISGGTLVVLF